MNVDALSRQQVFACIAPTNIFPQREGGGDTLGIRQQNNPNHRELDGTPRHIWEGKLDNFSRSSKLNYITNLIAHPRDFGPMGGELVNNFSKLSNSPWESPPPPPPPPLLVNIDRCIWYTIGSIDSSTGEVGPMVLPL